MKKYKRLTFRADGGVGLDCKACEYDRKTCMRRGERAKCTLAERERLAELEDEIERGTLVELPCNVGDTVYEVFKNHIPPFIQRTKIEKITITEKGLRLKLSRNSVYDTSISSLGKTLFLTEEEARKALKAIKERRDAND